MDDNGSVDKTPFSKRPASPLLIPGAILVIAAALRFAALGFDNLWYDELYNVWTARLPLADQIGDNLAAGHPPLYYLFVRVWFSISDSELWVRAFSALSGLVLVWLMYLLGRDLFSRQAGLWAAALGAVSPMLIWHSRAATFYSFLITLTTLSLYFLVRAAYSGGKRNWAAYVAATIAVYLTSFFGAVLQLTGFLVFWMLRGKKPGQLKPFLISQSLLISMVLLTLAVYQTGAAWDTSGASLPPFSSFYLLAKAILAAPLIMIGGDPGSGTGNSIWISEWMAGTPARSLMLVAVSILVTVIFVAFIGAGLRKRVNVNVVSMLVVALVLTSVTLFLAFINHDAMTSRFYIWAVPPLLVFFAALISSLSRRVQYLAGGTVLSMMLALAVWGVWIVPGLQDQISEVTPLLSEQYRDGDLVYGFPLNDRTVVDAYYLPDAPPPAGGFAAAGSDEMYFMPPGESWTGYRSGYWIGTGETPPIAGSELEDRVAEDIEGAARIWLIMPTHYHDDYPEIGTAFKRKHALQEAWHFEPLSVELHTIIPADDRA
jgi:4-amino-4-deoxy-L-arabinose transferase-like glycosyltransferase